MNITLPSHENFPEMFVSTWDSTTCEAFDNVVCGRKKREIAFCDFFLHITAFYLNADSSHGKCFYRLRFFWRVTIKLSSPFVPLYRV